MERTVLSTKESSEEIVCLDLFGHVIRWCNRFHVTYWMMRAATWLASFLPLRVSYPIAMAIGHLVYFCWGDKRRSAIANMRRVLGPDVGAGVVRRMARNSFRHYCKYVVEFLRFAQRPEDIAHLVRTTGWHNLDEALRAGKGVIIVGLHFGNWDLAGALLVSRGYAVNVVVESFEPAKLNGLIQKPRLGWGLRIIPLEEASRGVLRALRRNEILGLLMDRPDLKDGVPVRFCGALTAVPAGAAALALRTGARILPGVITREPDNTFHAYIAPAVAFEPTDDYEQDVQALTQRLMEALEAFVYACPDQWYMFRPMWPTAAPAPAPAF